MPFASLGGCSGCGTLLAVCVCACVVCGCACVLALAWGKISIKFSVWGVNNSFCTSRATFYETLTFVWTAWLNALLFTLFFRLLRGGDVKLDAVNPIGGGIFNQLRRCVCVLVVEMMHGALSACQDRIACLPMIHNIVVFDSDWCYRFSVHFSVEVCWNDWMNNLRHTWCVYLWC